MALSCPRCESGSLSERSVIPSGGGASTLVHRCEACKGLWLDGTTLAALCPTVAHLPEHKDEVALLGERGGGVKRCPRCDKMPYQFNVVGVDIDFCLQCQGVWLDGDEYEESMLEGEPRVARGGAYRRSASELTRDRVKCVDCGQSVLIKQTFLRENGHTCLSCHSRREITASQHRAAGSDGTSVRQDRKLAPEQLLTPVDAIVKAVSALFGKSGFFR